MASSSDPHEPASATVGWQPHAARAGAPEPDVAADSMDIDPRQGTLLGFEVPAGMIVAMTNESEQAQAEPAVPMELVGPARDTPTVEQERTMADTSSIGETPAAIERSIAPAASPIHEGSFEFDRPDPSDVAMTLASLEDAFVEEQREAAERWRRTRRWLTFALAGLALLLVVAVAQTVALIGFAHGVQATQDQQQATLSQQQATLASLTSIASAPPTGLRSTDGQVSAADQALAASAAPVTDAAAPRPIRHARSSHSRHYKERQRERDRPIFSGH